MFEMCTRTFYFTYFYAPLEKNMPTYSFAKQGKGKVIEVYIGPSGNSLQDESKKHSFRLTFGGHACLSSAAAAAAAEHVEDWQTAAEAQSRLTAPGLDSKLAS